MFNYVGLMTVDATYLKKVAPFLSVGKDPPPLTELRPGPRQARLPQLRLRRPLQVRRYFAPNAFNTPTTLEEIMQQNDMELFDLEKDPNEMTNLAIEPAKHKDDILRMNALLNKLIAQEVGVNDGQFLPAAVRPKK